MKQWHKAFLTSIFFSSILLSNIATAAEEPPREQLSKMLSSFKTMTATFQQKIYDGKGSVLQLSSGRMDLKRPGLFRWQINKPTKQILYANNDILWIYDVDLEQATKQKLNSNLAISPAQLLMGSTDSLAKEFNVTTEKMAKGKRFKLSPKGGSEMFEWVELQFNDGVLAAMRLSDNLGQMTVLKFSKVKINPTINDNIFKFTPKKGVDVIDQTRKK